MFVNPESTTPQTWKQSCAWGLLATLCFQAAYTSIHMPAAGFFILGYAFFLLRLTNQPNVRRAFYFGLATGFLCYAPQLFFFWRIFNSAAIVLWLILASGIALFSALACSTLRHWRSTWAVWLIPVIWTGVEYFRSELNYLKFSWLNVGYALPPSWNTMGMYSLGFLVFALAAALTFYRGRQLYQALALVLALGFLFTLLKLPATTPQATGHSLNLVGVQLEFPNEYIVTKALTAALVKNPDAPLFVLSECTLDGGITPPLKTWCRKNGRYLIVGGKDTITNDIYYNTTFVVGTNGEIIFKQAKSVPVQFFHDGLPAREQNVWDSPWGRLGICICYDLSYTRITDNLIKKGAQLLIVPTMDVAEWGVHQHELHSRVAPVRASEYGIPIFRLASSGISQAVQGDGRVVAQTHIGGNDEILSAQLTLAPTGRLPWDRTFAPLCSCLALVILVIQFFTKPKKHPADAAR